MSDLSPFELDRLADRVAERVVERLGNLLDPQSVLNSVQAAELLGISRATLERRISEGSIPCLRIGRLRRFRRSDLLGTSDLPEDLPP